MLGWIFRKKGTAPASAPAVAAKSPPPAAAAPAPTVDWAGRLAQARGDDDALLALMRTAGLPLTVKQAVVEALDGEAALKVAERDSRSHDRRIHQLAKRRLSALVARREAREQAARLIEAARGLLAEAGVADVAVNRGVELDRAWQALDADLLEPAVREQFAALTAQLVVQMRQRTDLEAQHKRWHAQAVQARQRLETTAAEAAAGTQDRAALAAAVAALQAVLDAAPAATTPAVATTQAELQQALQRAAALDTHLAVLDRLLAGPAVATGPSGSAVSAPPASTSPTADPADAAPGTLEPEPPIDAPAEAAAAPAAADPPAAPLPDDPQRAWRELPPLQDAALAALLQNRHARWQQAQAQAQHDRQAQRREQSRVRQRARQGEQGAALAEHVAQAEAALDAGQLADAHRHLDATWGALDDAGTADALRVRIAAAQARLAQLRGWQHWAGGRARDELVLQAEALAAATVAPAVRRGGRSPEPGEARASDEPGDETLAEAEAEVARLSIQQRAELIATLRARWKDIDRVGGPGGQALWRRFDTALKAADEPVVAHKAAQRAVREANLAARLQLLDTLDALQGAPGSAPAQPAAPGAPAAGADETAAPPPAPDAHALATGLDRFQAEWRKLGPIEHTVPRAARDALLARLEAVTGRVDAPLQAARRQARAEREALVARAHALADAGAGRGRDLVAEVRQLQADWQRHAKALPLARADEQALWTAFKAAIDAAFAAREASSRERDAEFEAHAAEREALIARLQLRPEDSPAAQRRTLAEVDAAWQRCGPAPRARAAALEAGFRAARDTLSQWLDSAAQRAWQAQCEALDARLALCQGREAEGAADADPAALAAAWQALPALPAPLDEALRRRAGLLAAPPAAAAPAADELLLQIETAWNLPTPPAYEAARRERKLLAMKAALEGRGAAAPVDLPADAALALLLGRRDLPAEQHERLLVVIAAWRRRGPQPSASGAGIVPGGEPWRKR